jgi:hypothetical protein
MITDLTSLKGKEIRPGVIILENPTPISGTNLMRALALADGYLCIVELKVTFGEKKEV